MGVKNFFVNDKAILEISDFRHIAEAKIGRIPNPNGKGTIAGDTTTIMADFGLYDTMRSALNSFETQVFDMALQNAGENLQSLSKQTNKEAAYKKRFTVQFNPSDLQIEGHGGGRMATTAFNNAEDAGKSSSSNVSMMPVPVYISLNAKLLFDNMNPNDCFLSAKTNIASSELAKSAVRSTLNAAGKNKKLSVQQEVEGLIAALRSPYTRCITFIWGELSYSGRLNHVSAQYTMFNSSGEPVRAVVQLSLVCADEGVTPDSLGPWKDAYNGAFGAGSNSLVSWTQKAGSLLNFSK